MTLLNILIVLIIVGILLWLINNYLPVDVKIKKIINIVTVVFVIVWLLKIVKAFAFLSTLHL